MNSWLHFYLPGFGFKRASVSVTSLCVMSLVVSALLLRCSNCASSSVLSAFPKRSPVSC